VERPREGLCEVVREEAKKARRAKKTKKHFEVWGWFETDLANNNAFIRLSKIASEIRAEAEL
jgi:hypothetical protein